jgi:hypothetical protein
MKKNIIYFAAESSGEGVEYIKIGKADDFEKRLPEIQTGNPRPLKLLASISSLDLFKEERLAHDYFSKYRAPKGEWFSMDILPLIPEYVKKRNGVILSLEEDYLNRKQTMINTLYDGLQPINNFRPRCYFLPHLPAQILGKAGTNETYRTIPYMGKRVFVSGSMWKIICNIKNSALETL